MSKLFNIFGCSACFTLMLFSFAFSQTATEQLVITSYYPSPSGSYRELRAQRMAIGDTYYNSSSHCWPGGPCGAPDIPAAASLVVEGNVGIGTTSPGATLQVTGAPGTGPWRRLADYYRAAGSEYPYIEVGYSATDGGITLGYINNAGLTANYGFVSHTGLNPAAGQGIILGSAGNVGIGTTGPQTKFVVSNGGSQNIEIDPGYIQSFNRSSPGYAALPFYGSSFSFNAGNVGIGTTSPGFTLTVNGTAWCTAGAWASDLRWKENITTLDNPLEKLLRLRGVEFDWKRKEFKDKNFPQGRQIGIIAQELEKEFPELVVTDKDGYKAIAYDKLTVVLLEAVKAQQKEIENLKIEIGKLKAK